MSNGVFIHRADSMYSDTPAARYHFPKPYLERVRACLGDWILYYEPVKVRQSKGYWAVARLERIVPDPGQAGLYYGVIEPGSFLEFANTVPFVDQTGPIERGLLNASGKLSGRAQAAVRPISHQDFCRILNAGLPESTLLPRVDVAGQQVTEDRLPFDFGDRTRVTQLVSRSLRTAAFRSSVLEAYGERCALTGLRLINGGGRAEVEAAHIQPVAANGPDMVANGLALSGTAHWMFDRGLISLADDLSILVSRQVNDRDGVDALLNKSGSSRLPFRTADRPHPHFLQWHREHCFKA